MDGWRDYLDFQLLMVSPFARPRYSWDADGKGQVLMVV
jgi:hypothetical protein